MNLPTKVAIVTELRNNVKLKPADQAARYSVSIEQIMDIVSKGDDILKMFKSACYQNALQMPIKKGKFPRMENVLYQWYLQQPARPKVTVKILTEKAIEIMRVLDETTASGAFRGSSTWMTGFKTRFNIEMPKRTANQSQNNNLSGVTSANGTINQNGHAFKSPMQINGNRHPVEPLMTNNGNRQHQSFESHVQHNGNGHIYEPLVQIHGYLYPPPMVEMCDVSALVPCFPFVQNY